jgi:hypothetical protein
MQVPNHIRESSDSRCNVGETRSHPTNGCSSQCANSRANFFSSLRYQLTSTHATRNFCRRRTERRVSDSTFHGSKFYFPGSKVRGFDLRSPIFRFDVLSLPAFRFNVFIFSDCPVRCFYLFRFSGSMFLSFPGAPLFPGFGKGGRLDLTQRMGPEASALTAFSLVPQYFNALRNPGSRL